MRPDSARQLRRLAFQLESLPLLTQHAQAGTISWAKLREVARIATPDTEAFWIEACQNHSYQEIERLVAHARDPLNRSHQSELRIQASAEAMALLERAMQSLSQEAGRILSPGEALEYLAAEYLSRRPLDTTFLEAARHQAQQAPAGPTTPKRGPGRTGGTFRTEHRPLERPARRPGHDPRNPPPRAAR